MYLSNLYLPTIKETPSDAELVSHKLMLRAGMIKKLSAGLYSWLPLGIKVLKKVETIVRTEMNRIHAQEILMPAVQPAELWQESNRWEEYGSQLLKIQDRHKRNFCFGPTHEEVVTDLLRNSVQSYKQLPVTLYQIQTKFRDEIRPRFGVMRAREFLMKDAYSFHLTESSLVDTYNTMYQAYSSIFTNLGLEFRAVLADSGEIGGKVSQEFHVIANSGEDNLLYSDVGSYAANVEVAQHLKVGDPSPDGNGVLKQARGIEVGHIFQLGRKYSDALHLSVLDQAGKSINLYMGCYGIGISRIVAASIEQNNDMHGIIWPAALAPFKIALVPIGIDKSAKVKSAIDDLYSELTAAGIDVLYCDTNERPGSIFKDLDLVGIPHRVVVSDKTVAENKFEYKSRIGDEAKLLSKVEILKILL